MMNQMNTGNIKLESIKKAIALIENTPKSSIKAEDVFEATSILIDDILEYTESNDVNQYEIGDIDSYALNLAKVANAISLSFETHKDELPDADRYYEELVKEKIEAIRSANDMLKILRPKIENLTNKKAELKGLQDEVSQFRMEISTLEKEVANLDTVDVESLRKRVAELTVEKEKKEKEISILYDSIDEIETVINNTKKGIITTVSEKKALFQDKESSISNEVLGFLSWKDTFIHEHKDRMKQMAEAQNQLTAIHNAWSSVSQRPELPEMLKNTEKRNAYHLPAIEVSNFEDIKNWFEETNTGLLSCISVYTEMYTTVMTVLLESSSNKKE